MRCTEWLPAEGIEPTVGSVGDSHDNTLAEATVDLYKTEVIRQRGPRHARNAAALATLEWVGRFNPRRRLEPIENIPPTGFVPLDQIESMRVAPYGSNEIAYDKLAAA